MKLYRDNLFLAISAFLGIISYEYNLYQKFYHILNLTSFLLITISIVIQKPHLKINDNRILIAIYFLILAILQLVNLEISDSIKLFFSSLLILILISSSGDTQKKYLHYFVLFILFTVPISFGIELSIITYWDKLFDRNSSIFFDPNYASALYGLSALLIYSKIVEFNRILFIPPLVACLYLTNSRGGLLSLILSIAFFHLIKAKLSFKIYLMLVFFILCYIAYSNFQILIELLETYFRFNQGFNDRDEVWKLVINYSLTNFHPIGIGEGGLISYIRSQGFGLASTHNYFIDYLAKYGIFFFCFNIFILSVLYYRKIYENSILPLTFILIISNSINISFGGVSPLSLVLTMILISNEMIFLGKLYPNDKIKLINN